uniref:Superoxide dismutase [Cu-Zn] n=1 Tax=Haptolina brevifila TaxID=156173 RepID=A0A6U7C8H9_9EUKA|mmetsp:Transcript_14657/g.29381  ORF Transcript_14657/g.29381 Transcript_14657/m.29381 type:complete len:252 (+) Transcript_14657:25-780(+)
MGIFGRKPPPPPPPALQVAPETIVQVALATVCLLIPLLFLLGRRRGSGGRSSAKLVATCELGVAGKPCGSVAAAKVPTPLPPPKDRSPKRTSITKQFAPEIDSRVSGEVKLVQEGGICTIDYIVRGLTPGLHGFHIHETADFSNGCLSAGPHYNPYGCQHGGPTDSNRHVGDLGNINADGTGVARGQLTSTLIKLSGAHNVIGRSFMVHANKDDLGRGDNSQPSPPKDGKCSLVTGNAGSRVACGEIKLVE